MIPPSDSSSAAASSSRRAQKPSGRSPNDSLRDGWLRYAPLVWQFGGGAFAVGGFAIGTNSLADVSFYLALLSFATAVFLSWFVRDRRRPQDLMAVFGYLFYAAGFGLLSSPDRFDVAAWGPAAYTLGTLFLALLLPLTWILFVGYLIDDGDSE